MALSIDSHAVLRAIVDNPGAFPAVQSDLDELARKMLGKQLKAKSTDAARFKNIINVTGESNVSNFLDSYQAGELASLVKKIDPFSEHAKAGGDPKSVRAHIFEIGSGRAETSLKPDKPIKVKAPKVVRAPELPKTGGVLESKVHSGKARASKSKKAG